MVKINETLKNIKGPDVAFKEEYLWNGWVKKKWNQRQFSLMRLAQV